MVAGNPIIYPKQNDNFKVNERMVRNKNLQRTSTLEMVMVFMLTLIVSMSIFLLFDILTIRDRLNFSDELDRVSFLDMNDFNDDKKVNHNEKSNSLGSSTSFGSSLFPPAKRKLTHRRNILSGRFKTTQPIDFKTVTWPDFSSPISTNVTRKNSLWIFKLQPYPKFHQDPTSKGKDSGLFNNEVTSLIPIGSNMFSPFDMNSHFSSIIISIKPINDTKSKPSGNNVISPMNSTHFHERNHTQLQRKVKNG